MKALGIVAVLAGLSGCGGQQQVQQYPDVEQDAEGRVTGSGAEVDRTRPPPDTGGPHPQDEPAGEHSEPL